MKVSIYQKSSNNIMCISINNCLGIKLVELTDYLISENYPVAVNYKENKFTKVYQIRCLLTPKQQLKIKKDLYTIGGANYTKDLAREKSLRKYKQKKANNEPKATELNILPAVVVGFEGNLITGAGLKYHTITNCKLLKPQNA